MKRKTRLIALLCVLAIAVGVTVAVSLTEREREAIAESGEVVFELPADEASALAWSYTDGEAGELSLSFTKEDGGWTYDGDAAFPVDDEAVAELLGYFEAVQAAFVIDDVTDYAQYGLEDPVCTIDISAGDGEYEILVGSYSELDYQRYISAGDGKVYLVNDDPMDYYKTELDDAIPAFADVERVEFSGAENYAIERGEDGPSYREDDVYYTENGVLDSSAVNSYVSYIASLALGDYYTYDASDEDSAAAGLDDPELAVTIDYPESSDEGAEILSFTIAFSRGAEDKLTDWDEVLEDMEAGEESGEAGEPADEDAVAYLRVGGSAIIYEISCDDFKALMACSYNDLRHTELFPAETEDIASLTVTLDGETHELTTAPPEDAESDEAGEDGGWYFGGGKIDIAEVEAAIASLSVSRFAKDTSSGATEISFTAVLDMEGSPAVSVRLYRIDGESCLASVNGESIGYVPRSQVVDLIEAVNAIVLG